MIKIVQQICKLHDFKKHKAHIISNLCIILFPFQLMHSQYQEINIWEKNVPNSIKSTIEEQAVKSEILRIKNVKQPTLTIFLPAQRSATGKGILILPGGGYGVLAYDWEGTDVAKWLNSIGIAAFVLKYRLPNNKLQEKPHKAPLQDAQQAMKMIRKNASAYNIKPDQLGVMGFSAGGHLASTLSTHFTAQDSSEVRPNFAALIYPVISMKNGITHKRSKERLLGSKPSPELITKFSNELQVSEKTPPTFIIHASDDKAVLVKNSILYYEALQAENVIAEMHIFNKGGHGFGLASKNNYLASWKTLFQTWIENLEE